MATSFKEKADVISILKTILDNYPEGEAVLRELLQNSDDAGATCQTFILDAREYSTTGLENSALERCQGPALVAINDSTFADKDWVAISLISNSSKSTDENTTGKYGLGFRSCYHITDNPQIYSKTSLCILDPHEEFPERFAGGIRLESTNGQLPIYPNLYLPFSSFAPRPAYYDGTAIRLPLRSTAQSRIKNTPVTTETVKEWFNNFIANELAMVMLFLKHITSIKLQFVSDDSPLHTIASARIVSTNIADLIAKRSCNRGRTAESSHYKLQIETKAEGKISTRSWMITQFVNDIEDTAMQLSKVLSRDVVEVKSQMAKDKLLPHIGLALPLHDNQSSGDFEGKLFTLLPLPLGTPFPLHVHGIFALHPSRQYLRSIQEKLGSGLRDRLLVEWNKLNFNTIIPRAWSYLLRHLPSVDAQFDFYNAWPEFSVPPQKQGDAAYWANLPSRMLDEVSCHKVWPDISGNLHELKDTLVASDESEELVRALESAGIPIIRPPRNIVNLIASSAFKPQILTPQSACISLATRIPDLRKLDGRRKDIISEFMASADDIRLFQYLPLLRNVFNNFVTIGSAGATMATKQEASLFHTHMGADVLLYDAMLPKTAQLMMRSTIVNTLSPSAVQTYIDQGQAEENWTIDWLSRFWEYVAEWEHGPTLMNMIRQYRTIPLADGAVHRVSDPVLSPADVSTQLHQALRRLAVPFLHNNITEVARIFLQKHRVIASPGDIRFLLNKIQHGSQITAYLSNSSRQALQEHFRLHLRTTILDRNQIIAFRRLPIFPILAEGKKRKPASLESAESTCHFVDSSVAIIPKLNSIAFVDKDECQEFVGSLRNAHDFEVKNELAILQLILDHSAQWPNQDRDVAKLHLERFFNRLSDLPPRYREQLRQLPFVDVGSGPLRPPSEVVDPDSKIGVLYDGNDGRLPVRGFGKNDILPKLQRNRFLLTELTTEAIEERIRNKAGTHGIKLLEVIDHYYQVNSQVRPAFLPQLLFNAPWLPVDSNLRTISSCRDTQPLEERLLYDLALPMVNYNLKSAILRERLGWHQTPTDKVVEQLRGAVNLDDRDRHRRICLVLKELATRLHNNSCSRTDLEGLRTSLANHPGWIPTSEEECASVQTCILDQVDLGVHSRFKRVQWGLRDKKVNVLLEALGVRQRPSVDALLSELGYLQTLKEDTTSLVRTVAAILTELSGETLTDEQQESLIIPTVIDRRNHTLLHPIQNVCYNDLGSIDAFGSQDFHFVHSSISPELASKLRIRNRSDLELQEVDHQFFDFFDIKEDLATRIKNTLKSYSEDTSSNEWVANAADAGASTVSFICNEGVVRIGNAPSPALVKQFEQPSLIVYNSATFTEDDFDGLKKVGEGGKLTKPESIGQFGLGLLTFYYFGDVIMLVSGSSVMFIDHSRDNLPMGGGRERKAGLRMHLEDCASLYGDLFSTLSGVGGFDIEKPYFDGTIFLVPLRTSHHALSSSRISSTPMSVQSVIKLMEGAFFSNAEKSLFFTGISSIQASHRASSGSSRILWSVNAIRQDSAETNSLKHHRLELTVIERGWSRRVSNWFIASDSSTLPSEFKSIRSKYKLPVEIDAAVAVQLSPIPIASNPQTLFATLPLPLKTDISAHVHTKWILSDSRRHIHLDSSNQHDPGLDTQFNQWLLRELIPPLLLSTISMFIAEEGTRHVASSLWPRSANLTAPSDRLIAESLYQKLPSSKDLLFEVPSGDKIRCSEAIFGFSANSSVHKVLNRLYPTRFVVPPFIPSYVSSKSVQSDTPAFLHSALVKHADFILNSTILEDVNIRDVIVYLLSGEQTLVGLPLLRLQSGCLVPFGRPCDPPVFVYNDTLVTLFGPDQVIAKDGKGMIDVDTCALIIKEGNVNLRSLDMKELRGLLARSRFSITPRPSWTPEDLTEAEAWITTFWKCLKAPSSGWATMLEGLEDLPLLPMVGGRFVSLSSCRENPALWKQESYQSDATGSIMIILADLGIPVINVHPSLNTYPSIFSFLDLPRYKISRDVTVNLVLHCMNALGTTSNLYSRVGEEAWGQLVYWILAWVTRLSVSEMSTLVSTYPILRSLPLWSAQQAGSRPGRHVLKSLEEVIMLPPGVQLSTVGAYMGGGATWFVDHSHTLDELLPPNRKLNNAGLVQRLQLPRSLHPEEISSFSLFLAILRGLGVQLRNQHFIPNGTLQLSDPSRLLHHTVPLYAFSFQDNQSQFVHTDFRHLMTWFESMGVERDLASEGFVRSVAAIHVMVESGRVFPEVIVGGRNTGLEVAFENLNRRPWIFEENSRQQRFNEIRGLRFVQRRESRSTVDQLEMLANDLPEIVALNHLVREEDHLVAWTQRARFAVEPSRDLKSVFPNIGAPTAGEVVEHLVTLVQAVRDSPNLAPLLSTHINATYRWLDGNSAQAAGHLRARNSEPLFRNVESGSSDMTTWHSASEMLFGLGWDNPEQSIFSVKGYLESFPSLLRAAGVEDFTRPTSEAFPTSNSLCGTFHLVAGQLRTEDRWADVDLRPKGSSVVKAHRIILASSNTYFRGLLTGDFAEANILASPQEPLTIPVPDYSYLEVLSAIHYLYTGEFIAPYRPIENDDRTDALAALTNMLDLSNLWEMEGLKLEAQRSIVDLGLIVQWTVGTLIERCQDAGANHLLEICVAFRDGLQARGLEW